MIRKIPLLALAMTGALVASAGAFAADGGSPMGALPNARFQVAAAAMGPVALGATADQRDVIQPPSSIDPGMALDPPSTGANMPVIHPPGAADHHLTLPR